MIPILVHIVKPDESLFDVSRCYGVPVEKLCSDNFIEKPEDLLANQALIVDIPDGEHQKMSSFIETFGYVYPTVKKDALERALKDLTYLCIFSYGVNMDGTPDIIDDEPIIEQALKANVAPVMVITNKYFSSYAAREILNNKDAQDRLINHVLFTLKTKNYRGLNIDFEYIFPQDRIAYNEFLEKVTALLYPMGLKVFSSLAPKTSEENKILYEAHDYQVHGKLSRRVCLMTYEWGYTYGPPMAVSLVDKVRKVLDYASTRIPAEKTVIGIPNYGYEWRLPWVEGTAATAVSYESAIRNAIENKAEIRFDTCAQAPYFYRYGKDNKLYVTWFEDPRSIRAKLDLVEKYKIAGVSFWISGNRFCLIRTLISSMYNILKVLE